MSSREFGCLGKALAVEPSGLDERQKSYSHESQVTTAAEHAGGGRLGHDVPFGMSVQTLLKWATQIQSSPRADRAEPTSCSHVSQKYYSVVS